MIHTLLHILSDDQQEESERVIRKQMITVMTGGAVGDQGCRASIQYNTQIQIHIHKQKYKYTKVMTPRAVSTG